MIKIFHLLKITKFEFIIKNYNAKKILYEKVLINNLLFFLKINNFSL